MQLQVGVKALIQNSTGEYLFLKRAKPYSGESECKWDVPGGRIEVGEPLHEALKREIIEETSLRLSGEPHVIFAQDILRDPGRHVVRITFLAKAEGTIVLDSKEHQAYQWVTLVKAKELYHDLYLTPVFAVLEATYQAAS